MITVRFPSGFSIQYNTANYCETDAGFQRIRKKEGGEVIARVPLDCIVEWMQPCRTYLAAGESPTVELQMNALKREIASLKRAINKRA